MSQSDCAIVSYVTTMDFHLSRMSVMILLQQIQHVIARANPNLSNHAHIITIPIMVIIRFMFIITITTSRGSSSGGWRLSKPPFHHHVPLSEPASPLTPVCPRSFRSKMTSSYSSSPPPPPHPPPLRDLRCPMSCTPSWRSSKPKFGCTTLFHE